jgi:beta-glucanase (GH16 family)
VNGEWTLIPELTDEFDGGKLDASKWHDHNPQWLGRRPGYFHPKNVSVSDGKLHLTMRHETLNGLPEGYHTFTSAAVKSKIAVLYGYFEIKCRPMNSHGSSAFWFYNNQPEIWTEIDVFEMGAGAPGHEHTVHMNAHVFHTPEEKRHWSRGGKWQAPYRLADEFHVYALEWNREVLRYLVDGLVVREMQNTHWHQPLHMNFDSETMPEWFGLPDPKDLPSTFSIEYVRSWRRVDDANLDDAKQ